MDTHEIKKKRGKIVSLSSGMHRKLLAFYGKGENVILLKFWKQQLYTRLLFLSIIVETIDAIPPKSNPIKFILSNIDSFLSVFK